MQNEDYKSRKNVCKKSFTYMKKFYEQELAAVNLSKIYLLKNAKKTCKPSHRDLIMATFQKIFNYSIKKC